MHAVGHLPETFGGMSLHRSRIIRQSFSTYATLLAMAALGAGIAVLTARLLGPQGKGTMSVLILIPILAVTLGRFGVGPAVIYSAAREDRPRVLFHGLVLTAGLGLLSAAAILGLVLALRTSVLHEIPSGFAAWMCAMAPVYFFFEYFGYAFQALLRFRDRNLYALAFPFAQFILLVLAVGVLRRGLTGAVVAWSVALAAATAASAFRLFHSGELRPCRLDRGLLRRLLGYGFRVHPGAVLELMNYRADFLIVNAFLGPAAVGLFGAAVNLCELVYRLPEAAGIVLVPHLSRMDDRQAGSVTPQSCRIILVFVLVFGAILFAGARPFVLFLFGPAFLEAVPVLRILLPGFLAFSVWKILAADLLARGKPLRYSLTSAVAFLVLVVLDILWIPAYGIRGAALSATLGFASATAVAAALYVRAGGARWRDLFVPCAGDLALVCGQARAWVKSLRTKE